VEAAHETKSVVSQLPPRVREHRLTLVSAGVAFYAFVAFVPTLIAVVSIYGLVSNPEDVERQVDEVASALPEDVRDFIVSQLTAITSANRAGVSTTLVIALVIALWSASGGMAALLSGLRVTHDAEDPKSFVAKRGLALALTLGAIVVLIAVVWLLAFLPAFIEDVGLGDNGRLAFGILRWPILAAVMVVTLGLLYRLAVPGREQRGVVTVGAVVGTAFWLVVSALFAFYTSNFASYSETYGVALASIVIVLLWLFLSVLAVLLGAEVDAIRSTD
jgi:membrane protein